MRPEYSAHFLHRSGSLYGKWKKCMPGIFVVLFLQSRNVHRQPPIVNQNENKLSFSNTIIGQKQATAKATLYQPHSQPQEMTRICQTTLRECVHSMPSKGKCEKFTMNLRPNSFRSTSIRHIESLLRQNHAKTAINYKSNSSKFETVNSIFACAFLTPSKWLDLHN